MKEYLSKRMVARGSSKAFSRAAKRAMRENGYVVVAKDGWIVKESRTGETVQLKRIDSASSGPELRLD